MKILLLAGTREARELSFAIEAQFPDVDLVSSLAGATQRPSKLAGKMRIGGFGGSSGLLAFLKEHDVTHVIDATHPFAVQMSQNAGLACARAGIELLRINRPPWEIDESWTVVSDLNAASLVLRSHERAFLATGRGSLAAFLKRLDVWFLVRVVDDTPEAFPLSQGEFLVSRPPFSVKEEMETLRAHRIDTLVTRNSGGSGGFEKIEAAMRLGLRVVMVDRPLLCEADEVETVRGALERVRAWA